MCLERVRTRVGHGFTDLAAAAHMHGEFRAACEGPGRRRYVLTDPPGDAEQVADAVAERAGVLGPR